MLRCSGLRCSYQRNWPSVSRSCRGSGDCQCAVHFFDCGPPNYNARKVVSHWSSCLYPGSCLGSCPGFCAGDVIRRRICKLTRGPRFPQRWLTLYGQQYHLYRDVSRASGFSAIRRLWFEALKDCGRSTAKSLAKSEEPGPGRTMNSSALTLAGMTAGSREVITMFSQSPSPAPTPGGTGFVVYNERVFAHDSKIHRTSCRHYRRPHVEAQTAEWSREFRTLQEAMDATGVTRLSDCCF